MEQLRETIDTILAELREVIEHEKIKKLFVSDYAGFWLYWAGEHLPIEEYQRLLAILGMDKQDCDFYKFIFTVDAYSEFRQKGLLS